MRKSVFNESNGFWILINGCMHCQFSKITLFDMNHNGCKQLDTFHFTPKIQFQQDSKNGHTRDYNQQRFDFDTKHKNETDAIRRR